MTVNCDICGNIIPIMDIKTEKSLVIYHPELKVVTDAQCKNCLSDEVIMVDELNVRSEGTFADDQKTLRELEKIFQSKSPAKTKTG